MYFIHIKKDVINSTKHSRFLESHSINRLVDFDARGKNEEEIRLFISHLDLIPEKRDKFNIERFIEELVKGSFFDFSNNTDSEYDISLEKNVIEFIIPDSAKKILWKQLSLLGINSATTYPDIQGMVMHIKDKFESRVI